jgi:ribosomal protein S18 acetylase RimI-like enzyme
VPRAVRPASRTRLYLEDEPPSGQVKLIGVLPQWRGQGLGRAILRWGVRRLQGRGSPPPRLP